MVTMRRRTVILSLTAGLAAALTGCSAPEPAAAPPAPSPSATTATPATPSTAPSATPSAAPTITIPPTTGPNLAPQNPTPVTVPTGNAPNRQYAVGTRILSFDRGTDRPLPVTLWYPAAGDAGGNPVRDAAVADGRFAVVLFSHGLTAQPIDYQAMLSRWAQAGFVVAAPAYPHTSGGVNAFNPIDVLNQPADATEVINQLLAKDTATDDPLRGHLDPTRVAAAGHSAGGITTVGLFTAARDSRLKAGIVFAGTDVLSAPFSGPAAPFLFVHGSKDGTVPVGYARTVFAAVPWSRAMLTVKDGGHLTRNRDFEVVTTTSLEFLRWSLYGDAAAKQRIPERAAKGRIATLENQL
jgi:predicted dienelactone hydrolase